MVTVGLLLWPLCGSDGHRFGLEWDNPGVGEKTSGLLKGLVTRLGLEPRTHGLRVRCSTKLS